MFPTKLELLLNLKIRTLLKTHCNIVTVLAILEYSDSSVLSMCEAAFRKRNYIQTYNEKRQFI